MIYSKLFKTEIWIWHNYLLVLPLPDPLDLSGIAVERLPDVWFPEDAGGIALG
jgi:hypothetical protein